MELPFVTVVPGAFQSHLRVDGKRVWLGFRIINGLARLAYRPDAVDVRPDGLVYFDDLIESLAASHEVAAFDYDWRAPLEQAAMRLATRLAEQLQARRRPVRLLAHASGALVVRAVRWLRPDVWDALMQRAGARVLMIAPAHHGTWATMQMLSGDDTFGNALMAFGSIFNGAAARQMLAGFPGLLQCQAGLLDPATGLGRAEGWRELAARERSAGRSNFVWGLPDAAALAQAVAFWQRMEHQRQQAMPACAHRFATVLGQAPQTTCGFEHSPDGLRYLATPAGDGRVTQASAMLEGVPAWQAPAGHGDLVTQSSLFAAYRDLLETGDTQRLLRVPSETTVSPERALAVPRLRAADTTRPLNEIKLILVGRGGAGKTSVARRLVHGDFVADQAETEGIDLSVWEADLAARRVRVNLWDFAGQELTHSTHRFFMSASSVYLLVASGGRDDPPRADVHYWLRLIQAFATDDSGSTSPVIVVSNKSQAAAFRLDKRALVQRYPFIAGFVATDCASGLGFDELRAALAGVVERSALVGRRFTPVWWQIRQALEAEQRRANHLSFEAFSALCTQHGVSDEAQQRSFAEVFHALGVALYYGRDPRLRDATVLNPAWVTRCVFKLLRHAVSDDGEALLGSDAVARALPNEPPAMQRYIVDLMVRFDLAVPLSDGDGLWLVPQRLWPEQPDIGSRWDEPDATRLRYSYPVLPKGLLPRFIARTHLLGADPAHAGGALPRWAEGVVLGLRESRALVRLDMEGRPIVDVTVVGPAADRLELLGVVQADFRTIHGDIANLGEVLELGVAQSSAAYVSVRTLLADERAGKSSAAQTPAGTLSLDARRELDRLCEPAARDPSAQRARVFVSYTNKDTRYKDELLNILKPLRDASGLIEIWHDHVMLAGARWDEDIRRALLAADVVVLLVSPDFIASDYVQRVEIRQAIARAAEGHCVVVPIMLWKTDLEGQPIQQFDPIPWKGKRPVGKQRPRSDAWYEVSRDLRTLLKARFLPRP